MVKRELFELKGSFKGCQKIRARKDDSNYRVQRPNIVEAEIKAQKNEISFQSSFPDINSLRFLAERSVRLVKVILHQTN